MSFVTVLMTVMTGFVLLAPVAMAVVLVTGGVPVRRPAVATAGATPRRAGCDCSTGSCTCVAAELPAAA
jgi:hypothetical protein